MDLGAELDVAGRNAAAGLEGQITLVSALDRPRIGTGRRARRFTADLDGLDQLGCSACWVCWPQPVRPKAVRTAMTRTVYFQSRFMASSPLWD